MPVFKRFRLRFSHFQSKAHDCSLRPGMTDRYGDPVVGRLEGPLRWAVDLAANASVAIEGPLPPPE